ncbi:thiamine/thiamine pyrophosphate ABC transporter permease [Thaumasiovibrio subtropicus]|uniref:thiamine/thiamine pyrophosphate ABC transporter permease n=1 Tax=Thaumasiovibrio subtropicus TaxID=1891207 RepID=UPI000B35FC37|nr:thiamine/thiamine pyrophosphate ABC transporter permease [Thaumasiovibrio subtropicus]
MLNSRYWSTTLPGLLSAGLIVCFIFGALLSLWLIAPTFDIQQIWQDPYLRHITAFSFIQATYSTLLSLAIAIPLAESLSHRRFPGRRWLLRLFSLTQVLPVLIVVVGLLAIYGNSGLLNRWLGTSFSIYGLSGILLAHVFFNAPLSAKLLLISIESIPVQQHQLAAHLGLNRWQRFQRLAWPRIRQQIPHVCGLVFMLCFTSFATVMALGGGPKATTIELAIYQAIRFDFDLGLGAMLAVWQMGICTLLVLVINRFAKPVESAPAQGFSRYPHQDSLPQRGWDIMWLSIGFLLVLPPFIAVVSAGINTRTFDVLLSPQLWQATLHSLHIALFASLIAIALGITLLNTSRHWRLANKRRAADSLELAGSLILVTPGLVISTGLFLMVRHFSRVYDHALWLVITVNALMAMPFVLKALSQPLLHCAQQFNPLCESLGMRGVQRWRRVEWPLLAPTFVHAFALAFVLSLGDLTAIALFGSQDFQTLPLYLFQLMGSYQLEAAAVVALVLLVLSLSLFALAEKCLVKRQST